MSSVSRRDRRPTVRVGSPRRIRLHATTIRVLMFPVFVVALVCLVWVGDHVKSSHGVGPSAASPRAARAVPDEPLAATLAGSLQPPAVADLHVICDGAIPPDDIVVESREEASGGAVLTRRVGATDRWIITPPRGRTFVVTASAGGFAPEILRWNLSVDPASREVLLSPSGVVVIAVADTLGTPIRGATVAISASAAQCPRTIGVLESDEDGEARFEGVPNSVELDVTCAHPNFVGETRTIQPMSGCVREHFMLRKGAALRARWTGRRDPRRAPARVVVESDGWYRSFDVNGADREDGMEEIGRIPIGTATVFVVGAASPSSTDSTVVSESGITVDVTDASASLAESDVMFTVVDPQGLLSAAVALFTVPGDSTRASVVGPEGDARIPRSASERPIEIVAGGRVRWRGRVPSTNPRVVVLEPDALSAINPNSQIMRLVEVVRPDGTSRVAIGIRANAGDVASGPSAASLVFPLGVRSRTVRLPSRAYSVEGFRGGAWRELATIPAHGDVLVDIGDVDSGDPCLTVRVHGVPESGLALSVESPDGRVTRHTVGPGDASMQISAVSKGRLTLRIGVRSIAWSSTGPGGVVDFDLSFLRNSAHIDAPGSDAVSVRCGDEHSGWSVQLVRGPDGRWPCPGSAGLPAIVTVLGQPASPVFTVDRIPSGAVVRPPTGVRIVVLASGTGGSPPPSGRCQLFVGFVHPGVGDSGTWVVAAEGVMFEGRWEPTRAFGAGLWLRATLREDDGRVWTAVHRVEPGGDPRGPLRLELAAPLSGQEGGG